jgi:hypothetical protein
MKISNFVHMFQLQRQAFSKQGNKKLLTTAEKEAERNHRMIEEREGWGELADLPSQRA